MYPKRAEAMEEVTCSYAFMARHMHPATQRVVKLGLITILLLQVNTETTGCSTGLSWDQ